MVFIFYYQKSGIYKMTNLVALLRKRGYCKSRRKRRDHRWRALEGSQKLRTEIQGELKNAYSGLTD